MDRWPEHVEAATVTVVAGLSPADLGKVLPLVAASEQSATFNDALWRHDIDAGLWRVQDEELPEGQLVIVEPNGFLTSLPENLAALSGGGAATSLFWNVNSVMSFQRATAGEVRRSFDPLFRWEDHGQGEPLPQEAGLFTSADGDPRHDALELLRRTTGLAATHDWLLSPTRRTRLARY